MKVNTIKSKLSYVLATCLKGPLNCLRRINPRNGDLTPQLTSHKERFYYSKAFNAMPFFLIVLEFLLIESLVLIYLSSINSRYSLLFFRRITFDLITKHFIYYLTTFL